jgi:hypothetical protein
MTKPMSLAGTRMVPVMLVVVALSVVAWARTGDKAQLDGRWNFNPTVSDDAAQKVADAQQSGHRASGEVGHTYPGGPGPQPVHPAGVGVDTPVPGGGISVGDPEGTAREQQGGPLGRPGGEIAPGGTSGDPGTNGGSGGGAAQTHRSAPINPALEWLIRNPQFLQIDQRAKEMVIADDSGHSQTYYPDGKKHEAKDANGSKIWTKAEWEGSTLVAETKMANSELLTESFRPSEDGNQIYVKTRFESPSLGGLVNIRRVYDLAKAPSK